MCESCGWDSRRKEPSLVGFVAVLAVFPLMCCGYCFLGYPLALYVSPFLATPVLWVVLTCLFAWGVYRLFDNAEKNDK